MIPEREPEITFNSDLEIDELPQPDQLTPWLIGIAAKQNKTISTLSYQFVSDEELHEMNVRFLDHDTYTDILTFPYSYDPIESDIFISIDRTRDNAGLHKTSITDELLRVIAHGLLHMCGFSDESPEDKQAMRELEDECLESWKKS